MQPKQTLSNVTAVTVQNNPVVKIDDFQIQPAAPAGTVLPVLVQWRFHVALIIPLVTTTCCLLCGTIPTPAAPTHHEPHPPKS